MSYWGLDVIEELVVTLVPH